MAHPALNSMVAPGQKRPRIMMNGIMQIAITRACNLSCTHCTQGSNLAGKPAIMTVEQFEQAITSLDGYWGVKAVFGGNPCVHPHFDEICRIMRAHVPFLQRGIWTNNLMGKGRHARITFNPRHSNLNVHLDREAEEEFKRDWPESSPYVKGMNVDSVHSSPWVSPIDLGIPEEERWRMIADCDINKHWSAIIGVIRGELRAFFCEVAYSQAALHEKNPDWSGTDQPMPDTGLPVTPGWWKLPMEAFEQQVLTHCHACGIPLRRKGQFAINGEKEEFTKTHSWIARPKAKDRRVEIVEPEPELVQIGVRSDRPSTEYLKGITPGYATDIFPSDPTPNIRRRQRTV